MPSAGPLPWLPPSNTTCRRGAAAACLEAESRCSRPHPQRQPTARDPSHRLPPTHCGPLVDPASPRYHFTDQLTVVARAPSGPRRTATDNQRLRLHKILAPQQHPRDLYHRARGLLKIQGAFPRAEDTRLCGGTDGGTDEDRKQGQDLLLAQFFRALSRSSSEAVRTGGKALRVVRGVGFEPEDLHINNLQREKPAGKASADIIWFVTTAPTRQSPSCSGACFKRY